MKKTTKATAPPVPTGWQPIETAPKDGTYILLACASVFLTAPPVVESCKYDPRYFPLYPWVDYAGLSFCYHNNDALYWMPLPPFPCVLGLVPR